MMADSLEVELLRQRDIAQYGSPDGPTFRYLVKKLKKEGLEGNDLYEAIVEFVSSTNAGVNRRLGI
jgi:PII-like signaling protein